MKEDIEKLINEQLESTEPASEELISQIETRIKEQNISADEQIRRRKIIKNFLETNHIKSIDELSDEQIKNILSYKM